MKSPLFTISEHPGTVKRLSIQWKGNILQKKTKYCKDLHRNRIPPILLLALCFSISFQNTKEIKILYRFANNSIQLIFNCSMYVSMLLFNHQNMNMENLILNINIKMYHTSCGEKVTTWNNLWSFVSFQS